MNEHSHFLVRIASMAAALLVILLAAATLQVRPAAAAEGAASQYRLGAGDVIRINVFRNPDLLVEARVTEGGTITYPLVGNVDLGGQSVPEAEQTIARLLREGGFVQQPQVNILVLQMRAQQVSVLGMVNRPGRYPIELANSKLTDILAQAGGPAPGGADTVVLIGERGGKPINVTVDLPSLIQAGKLEDDVAVQGGDLIYVHRAPTVYIYGEVNRPGAYRLERDMTVMQALALGGGVSLRGTQRGLRLHRRNGDGKVEVIEPDMNDALRPDDVIYIRESIF